MTTAENETVTLKDRLWTIEETASFLMVPINTLYQWRYLRCGPPSYKLGRHVRYDPEAVRAWVNTCGR